MGLRNLIDIQELRDIYKNYRLKFNLMMLIYAGAIVELLGGRYYMDKLSDRHDYETWELFVMVGSIVTIRYTINQAISNEDTIVGVAAMMMSIWYTQRVFFQVTCFVDVLTTALAIATTLVGAVWLYQNVRKGQYLRLWSEDKVDHTRTTNDKIETIMPEKKEDDDDDDEEEEEQGQQQQQQQEPQQLENAENKKDD